MPSTISAIWMLVDLLAAPPSHHPTYTRAAQKSITGDAKPGWSTNEIGRVSVGYH